MGQLQIDEGSAHDEAEKRLVLATGEVLAYGHLELGQKLVPLGKVR